MAILKVDLGIGEAVPDVIDWVRSCISWYTFKEINMTATPSTRYSTGFIEVSKNPPFTDDEARKIAEKFQRKYGRVLEVIPD
jgi:hypothetical protein